MDEEPEEIEDDEGEVMLVHFKPVQGALKLDGQGDGGEMVLAFERTQVATARRVWEKHSGKGFVITFLSEDAVREGV